jgi:hypothetical protein
VQPKTRAAPVGPFGIYVPPVKREIGKKVF